MIVIKSAPQAVTDHDVSQAAVAHAVAPAGFGIKQVRGVRHAFHAAGDNHIGIAGANGLGSQINRLKSGTADLVDGVCRYCRRQAGADGSLPGRILAQTGLEDVAEDDFVDSRRIDFRPAERFPDHDRTQFRRGQGGQRTVETADSGSDCAGDNYFSHCASFLSV